MAEPEDALFLRAAPAFSGVAVRTVAGDGALDDSGGDGGVGVRIDHDEAAGCAILSIGIEEQRQRGLHIHRGDFVHIELRGGHFFERVDVDPMAHLLDARREPCAWCA